MRDYLGLWAEKLIFIMFKQSCLLFFLLISLQLSSQNFSTTAVGGCTSAEVISTLPSYQVDLWIGPFIIIDYVNCKATLDPGTFGTTLRARFILQKYNHSTGNWVSHAGPQSAPKFNNLPHGTYRILAVLPKRFSNIECQEGFEVYTTLGQSAGWWGTYTNGREGTSNAVVVGKTVPADIAYHFVDGGGGDLLPNGFDYGEVVTMNATATKNYDTYWLAIFENTTPFRYWSQGWNSTTPPLGVGSINLTDLAGVFFGGNFGLPGTMSQYTVQFAVENSACGNASWVNNDQVFVVCPSGFGCRFEQSSLAAPKLFPNPSVGSLQASNLEDGGYELKIVDISGRLVKVLPFQAGAEILLEGVSAGMYAASIWQNGLRLHTEKLVINR